MKKITIKTEEGGILKDGDNFWYVIEDVDGLHLKYWNRMMASFAENLTYLRDKKKKYFLSNRNAKAYIRYKNYLNKTIKNLHIQKT